jgi:hypothetical protein
MKENFWVKLSATSGLFLTTAFLLILGPFSGNAQESAASGSLEGTSWQGQVSFLMDSGDTLTMSFKYSFAAQGEVKESYVYRVSGLVWRQHYHPGRDEYVKEREYDLAKESYVGDAACTYKQDGKSVQIKCGEGTWNATIQSDRMVGEISLKPRMERTVTLSLERISPLSASSAPDKPSTDDSEFVGKLRIVYRRDVIHCPQDGECNKEATDDDLADWLFTVSRSQDVLTPPNALSFYNIDHLRSDLGNGFGTEKKSEASRLFLLPPGRGSLGEIYIVGLDDDSISFTISISRYEEVLRRRMDWDASGKVSEDEFVNYAVKNRNYVPVPPAKSN